MREYLWSSFYRIQWNKNLSPQWGWNSYRNKTIPKGIYYEEDNIFFNKNEFKEGVKRGYKIIFHSFYERKNFLYLPYATPKLSIGLNILHTNQFYSKKPDLDFQSVKVDILGSWTEYGLQKSNEKILGMWDRDFIYHEICTGCIGPEVQHIWDQKPIRQNVKVLYQFSNRQDIWIWQRCLIKKNYRWNVYNINNILI